MRKKLLFAPLWGIFALSLLSSCRTEDGAVTQKQIEDKRFAVFVPKDGRPVNYANGFALVMKKYDEKKNTNLSGINNNLVINNLTASAGKRQIVLTSGKKDIYVEFNIRSETIEEKNGDKWVIYPRVQGTKVKELVVMLLTEKETLVKFFTYNKQTSLYKEYGTSFQEALDKYLSRSNKLNLNASIKPIAEGETLIKEVILTVKRKAGGISPGTPGEGEPGMGGDGAVDCFGIEQCIRLNPGGGGGESSPTKEADKIDITDLQKYPCAFAIAQDLPYLKNDLGTVLNKIFKNSDKYNINFKISKILDATSSTDGKTQPSDFKKEDDKFTATIFLNKAVLENATKEYILATMYHEVVHAYLDFELYRLGKQEFSSKYPGIVVDRVVNTFDEAGKQYITQAFVYYSDHTEAASYIGTLENIIKEYNPKLPAETAKILAKSGMVYLTPDEMKINERERGINKTLGQPEGTKCTN
ncbi:hypothetical protein [Elizabethkingia anophelis]|uniref:hypothetical protein n=1 Tax=Elizabethkingia anophelis TaxID=1117645 RepID=UPI00372F4491